MFLYFHAAHVHPGYFRIAFALVAFYFMPTNYVVATMFYSMNELLDNFDGWLARRYNQSKSVIPQQNLLMTFA